MLTDKSFSQSPSIVYDAFDLAKGCTDDAAFFSLTLLTVSVDDEFTPAAKVNVHFATRRTRKSGYKYSKDF